MLTAVDDTSFLVPANRDDCHTCSQKASRRKDPFVYLMIDKRMRQAPMAITTTMMMSVASSVVNLIV
jgi:hypothetical protein